MTRETIYAALWAKISSLSGFNTRSRRLKHWVDCEDAELPALFMAQAGEMATQKRGLPAKWSFIVNLHIYVSSGADPNSSPAPVLNALLDALEAALAPDKLGFCTLGGLVVNAWISGKIMTLEGILGGREIALVPVEIEVNA
jgi:hypothetical protein